MSATTTVTPSPFCVAAAHRQGAAQRHELRIVLDVGDEIEHVGGGVADAALGGELRH